MINNNAYILILPYLRQAPGEHAYLAKKTGILPVKIVRNYNVFVLQK